MPSSVASYPPATPVALSPLRPLPCLPSSAALLHCTTWRAHPRLARAAPRRPRSMRRPSASPARSPAKPNRQSSPWSSRTDAVKPEACKKPGRFRTHPKQPEPRAVAKDVFVTRCILNRSVRVSARAPVRGAQPSS
eukprot:117286-Prymnesium_polylepis.2